MRRNFIPSKSNKDPVFQVYMQTFQKFCLYEIGHFHQIYILEDIIQLYTRKAS